jgi:hypothetical protein
MANARFVHGKWQCYASAMPAGGLLSRTLPSQDLGRRNMGLRWHRSWARCTRFGQMDQSFEASTYLPKCMMLSDGNGSPARSAGDRSGLLQNSPIALLPQFVLNSRDSGPKIAPTSASILKVTKALTAKRNRRVYRRRRRLVFADASNVQARRHRQNQ